MSGTVKTFINTSAVGRPTRFLAISVSDKKKKRERENNTRSFPLSDAICYSSRKLSRVDNDNGGYSKNIAPTWYFLIYPATVFYATLP